jgi:hypothetical protein
MEIAANNTADLGVPATLDAPIQATFTEMKGWVRKWLQDQTAREEKEAGVAQLGVPGPSTVAWSTLSSVDSLPSVKIADPQSWKVSNLVTPWIVLTPHTADTRAGHGEEGQGYSPQHPCPPLLGVRVV